MSRSGGILVAHQNRGTLRHVGSLVGARMTAQEYLTERLEDQIAWYDGKSGNYQRWFKRLRLAEIIAAAALAVLSGFVSAERALMPALVAILGGVVVVIAGALGLYQFEHHWVEYRATCESLRKERFLFLTGAQPYDLGPDENYKLLVQRVEGLLSKENAAWAQQMSMSHAGGAQTDAPPPSASGL